MEIIFGLLVLHQVGRKLKFWFFFAAREISFAEANNEYVREFKSLGAMHTHQLNAIRAGILIESKLSLGLEKKFEIADKIVKALLPGKRAFAFPVPNEFPDAG